MKQGALSVGVVSVALALGGCGGDDGEGSGSAKTTAATLTPDAVLSCLKAAGTDAEDQSNSSGDKIGIDYPGGRLLVSFEDTPEDAETYASVAETNGETAVVKGSVVITIPEDPDAKAAQPTVEKCVEGG